MYPLIFLVINGHLLLKAMPAIIGMISNIKTVDAKSMKDRSNALNFIEVGSYNLAQKAKLSGVKIGLNKVAIDVRETDKATLALANELIKFDMLPPGHEATKNIPNAKPGFGLKK